MIAALLRSLAFASLALLLTGCPAKKNDSAAANASDAAAAPDNSAEVQAYFAAHPNFFVVKTPADLPADLAWQDGSDLPELGSPERKRGGTFNGRIQDFPRTLRTVGPDSNSGFRSFLLDDNAVGFGQLHPNAPGPHRFFAGLATSWAVDLPAKTVYVRIDPAARWSDGPAVTTDDVFFMFWFFQSRYIQAPWYNNYYGIGETYTRITRYDTHTFAVTLTDSRPDLLSRVLGLRPSPAHFYRELGDDFVTRYNWRFEPTTGPWVITDAELKRTSTSRNNITLSRLENWWANEKPQFRYRYNPAAIRLRVIRETPKAFEAFLLGELDAFGMSLAEYNYDRLPDDHPLVQRGLIHKVTFFNDVPRPNYGLWMNTAKAPLDDQNVRLGIQHATNWQLVIDQYFRGDYTRLHTSNQGYGDMSHPTIRGRAFDVTKAREYFTRAGYTATGPDGILRKPDGTRLSVGLTTGYEALAPVLTILQEEARKAGIEYRVEILDASAAWKKVQEKNHDITFSAFGIGVELYPRYWETHHSANAYDQPFLDDGKTPNPVRKPKVQTNNLESIAIPELDALITAYDKSDSLDTKRTMAQRMEEILYENASFAPGFALSFFRTASWRWMKFPEGHAYRFSDSSFDSGTYWIDESAKTETLSALRDAAKTFPPSVELYDQWKAKE